MSAGIEAAIALHWWKACIGIIATLLGLKFQKSLTDKEERLKNLENKTTLLSETLIEEKMRVSNLEEMLKQSVANSTKLNEIHTSVEVIKTKINHLEEGR